jgi:hypothetical protein
MESGGTRPSREREPKDPFIVVLGIGERDPDRDIEWFAESVGFDETQVGGIPLVQGAYTALWELLTQAAQVVDVFIIAPVCTDAGAVEFSRLIESQSPTSSVVLVRDGEWTGDLTAAMKSGIHEVVADAGGTTDSLQEAVGRAFDRTARFRVAFGASDTVDDPRHSSNASAPVPTASKQKEVGMPAQRVSKTGTDISPAHGGLATRRPTPNHDKSNLRRIVAGVGAATIVLVLFYVQCIAPVQLDVRYCGQFLDIMEATNDLTSAPTAEQAQQLRESVKRALSA